MFSPRPASNANYRFRFRSEPSDPRQDDIVRSVPYSQKELRRRRWAHTWMVGKCLLISTAVIALLTFAQRIWHETITLSPNFAVGEYAFHSNVKAEHGGLTKDLITEVTGLRADLNVMKVDLSSLHAAIKALPQVQKAVVQRIFPNRIDIDVTERQPVAWLACAQRGLLPRDSVNGKLLDDQGTVFECRSLLTPYNHLPVINIPNLAWLEVGQALTDRRALQALSLLGEFNSRTWCQPTRIQEILLENDYAQTVTLSDGATVIIGQQKTAEQITRLEKIYQWSKEHGKAVATAQLLAEQNVPVTFAPPAKPKSTAATDSTEAAPKPKLTAAQARESADIRAIVRGN